jgi:hypothetical protein
VQFDGERVAGMTTLSAMVDALVHDLNRRVVDASPHLLLHAGGVAGAGVAVALPGHMEAGKTTLTAGLVRAGLGYLTDEALAFDRETLLALPYPKPLSIDPGAWPLFLELAPPESAEGLRLQPMASAGYSYPTRGAGRFMPTAAVVFPATRRAPVVTALVPVGRGRRWWSWPRTPSDLGAGRPELTSWPIWPGASSATG